MANEWYKVEFCGRPPEGKEPIVPGSPFENDELLVLGGKLADLFGFEWLDDLRLTKVQPA